MANFHGLDVNLAIVASGLTGAGTVIVPDRQFRSIPGLIVKSLEKEINQSPNREEKRETNHCLAAKVFARTTDPDVFSLDLSERLEFVKSRKQSPVSHQGCGEYEQSKKKFCALLIGRRFLERV